MRTLSVSSALVMLTLVSCKTQRDNPNHCQNNDGNNWCGERDPSRPFCSIGACTPDVEDGCVAERPEDDACYSPCGDDQTFEDDPSCDGVADTGTDSATLTGSMSDTAPTATTDDPTLTTSMSMSMSASESETETTPTSETDSTTGPTGCVSSDECTDPMAPICQEMVCTGCTSAGDGDAACEEKNANAPVCRDDGACVQCTPANASACDDETPICDEGASSCVGCAYHSDCAATACDIETGACFAADAVVYVDGDDAACDDGGSGTMAVPYCEIQPAIDGVGDGESAVIRVAATGAPYSGSLTVDGGESIAILGSEIPFPTVTPSVGSTLSVTGGSTRLYVEGLRFASNNNAVALSLSGGDVVLDRVEVVQNLGNGAGILVTAGADLRLRNSVVGSNGADGNTTYGVRADAATFAILYSTIAANAGNGDESLSCINAASGEVRNSIIGNAGGTSIVCAGLMTASDSWLDTDLGDGTVEVGAVPNNWFINVFASDFHLAGGHAAALDDLAVWEAGDPPVDLDGDARPSAPDTPDVAGADLP